MYISEQQQINDQGVALKKHNYVFMYILSNKNPSA